ncbi:MAG: MG2 domain-containing protein [Chloroflexia bacterium]
MKVRWIAPAPFLGFLLLVLLVLLPAFWGLAAPLFPSPTGTPLPTVPPTAAPTPSPTPVPPALIRWRFVREEVVSLPPGETASLTATGRVPSHLHAPLVLTFDRPLGPSETVLAVVSPSVALRQTAVDERSLALTPVPGWQPDTRYTLEVRTASGSPHLIFTTRPWAMFSGTPRERDPQAAVQLRFSYPVDPRSVEQALRLEPATPYRLSWSEETLLLEPEEAWESETTYTLTLGAGVRDEAGVTLERPLQWTFTTRSGVVSAFPRGQATPCDSIGLTFDRPADRASVEAAFHITPTIAGTFEWQDRTLRFIPRERLSAEFYQVLLEPSARAADGSPFLRKPLRWDFRVNFQQAAVNFGYGPNIQILDAAGPRRIQFDRWDTPSCPPTFVLYPLSPERLLADYTSSLKSPVSISIEGLPVVRQWTAEEADGEVTLPADLPPGLYVLASAASTGQGDRLIVVLTHYALVLKEASTGLGTNAQHQVAGYATSISTGRPRSGMSIRLYDRSGRLYGQGTTDEQGRFETTVIGDTDPLIAIGEVEGEMTLCGFGPEWDAQGGWWSWRGWLTNPPTGRLFRVYVYTDRPIYRPGQTVHVRAVVRSDDDALYALPPAGTPITVRLRDARNNVLGTQALSLNEFGTAYTSFALAEGGTLGIYNVEVAVGDEVTRQALKVEEYRKPDYQVTVTADRERYLLNETMTVTVEARYYFGRPVAGVPVKLTIYKQAYDEWSCGMDGSNCWAKLYQEGDYRGTTDAQGRWVVRIPAKVAEYSWWSPDLSRLDLEATVEDGSGQAVSGHALVEVYRNPQGAALLLSRHIYRPGEEIPLEVAVHDYRGMPVAGVRLRGGIYRWDGNGYNAPVAKGELVTDASGRARLSFHVDEQGWFRVLIHGEKDLEDWIWVYDPSGVTPWAGLDQSQGLSISADKSAYAVGETAQLLVRSPVTGTALLTLERGRVRRMQPVELTGAVTYIALPVEADFVPNVFVTVQIYRPTSQPLNHWSYTSIPDAELLIASTELAVPPEERRLKVTLTPQRPTYTPREEAEIVIQVTDVAGRPVQAELSLAVVDEAIYALSQDLSPDPFEAFYGRRSNLVRTYHSLKPVRELGGAEMGGGGDGIDVGNPRRHFPDTAYWNPRILTDAEGRAVVTLHLPDSLTRWRLLARAVTADTRLGEGTAALTVTQSLIVRPAVPRFLIQGDTFTLTATVHNDSEGPLALQAGLLPQGLDPRGPLSQTLSLAAGETAPLGWVLAANTLGTVTITAYARGGGLSDAVQYNIPVRPFAVPRVETWAGEFIGEHVERIVLPERMIPEATTLEVRLSPSVVNALLDGLEYLIDYPFG